MGDRAVRYVSNDASDPLAATLENATFAPALNAASAPGADGTDAARASLAAFINGQPGAGNPNRQGLNSAIPTASTRSTSCAGTRARAATAHCGTSTSPSGPAHPRPGADRLEHDSGLVDHGRITGPGGASVGPAGFIVDCPIIFRAG
jgi:hypothetical protein